MRDFEYGVVMRASQGVKTHGFSSDKMAEIGSQKEAVRQKLVFPQKTNSAVPQCRMVHLAF
jgi:hypothetical protein